MSNLMLHAVLNMPPDLWNNSEIDKAQRHARYKEASQLIENQRKQIAIMVEALQIIRNGGAKELKACELARKALEDILEGKQ